MRRMKEKDDENNYDETPAFSGATPPEDTFNIAYLIYFALGAGILLPWNAFIAAVDYFDYLYPNTHIDRVFSIAYMFPSFIFLLFLMDFGRTYSMKSRINCGLVLYLITILVVPAMDEALLKGQRGTQFTHYVTVGAVVLTGIADALAQGSLVGAAGELPERYMQALFGGTAASGVIVSLLRIVTKAALPATASGLRMSSDLYFGVSGAFVVICIVFNNLVDRLPVIRYYNQLKLKSLDLAPLLKREEKVENGLEKHNQSSYSAEEAAVVDLSLPNLTNPVSYLHVFKQIQALAIALASIYVVTLSIFPGFITEDVHSTALGDWYPILLIAAYNFSDFVGKMLTALYCIENRSLMVGGCIVRVLFFPLFAGCLHGPKILRTEAPVFILTSLLGVTNGYLTSAIMMYAPKVVSLQEAETAGIILVIFLVAGLATGSGLGWVWVI
ncbi:hypothetical protein O6H91_14G011700 [Diphasiastrum complanatum]|uniref:Uncharacterized protein n=1 Tax=Diphasiastrum complanatum TaxID=34168 RepID=A0ACC2BLP6_DIPCM|nr:hypothetical protein O6H91_14G011700 [Diphasiastrum complanatum]